MNKQLFFLVNGNAQIGFGHVNRCLMFANEAKKMGVNSIFVGTDNDERIVKIIENNGFECKIANGAKKVVECLQKKSYLIIDSDNPEFRTLDFQNQLLQKEIIFMHISVDDTSKFLSHYVLNPNIIAETLNYSTAKYTKKLLGPKYFILNEKSKAIEPKEPVNEKEKYIALISFGSADPLHNTEHLLQCIDVISKDIEKLYVIVGPLNDRLRSIKELVKQIKINIEVVYNTKEMYSYMEKCDIAFTSMGLTFWELTLHNIPCLCISGSTREENVLDFIATKEYCYKLGHGKDFDKASWKKKLKGVFEEKKFLVLKNEELRKSINKKGITFVLENLLK